MVTVSGHAVAGAVSLETNAQLTIGPSGALSVSGGVQVAGTLALESSSARVRTPTLSVARKGMLTGVGVVHGNVEDAGAVDVLDGGSGVPLRVSGRYRQRSGATLLLRYEAGTFTQLNAASTSLNGRLDLLILDALAPGSKYTTVSGGPRSGRFAHVGAGYVVRYRAGRVSVIVTPQIRLNRSTVAPGEKITVSGASFGYLGTVTFHLDTAAGPVVGSSNITSVGSFQGTASIPPHASPGLHVIVAVESPHGYRARAAFTVP